jgi:hypothetical protein
MFDTFAISEKLTILPEPCVMCLKAVYGAYTSCRLSTNAAWPQSILGPAAA